MAESSAPEITEVPFMLYTWYCPYVHRVALACSAKQWHIKEVDIDLRNKPSWFLDISPHGKVPVIVFKEGGKTQVIYESLVLVDFVEDFKAGGGAPSLLPASATDRAMARIAISRYDSKLVSLFYKMLRETDREAALGHAKEIGSELEWLQQQMSPTGPFFMGEHFSTVDAAVLPWLLRDFILRHYRGYELLGAPALAKLRAYVEAARKHPLVAATYKPPAGGDWEQDMIQVYQPYGGTPTNFFST